MPSAKKKRAQNKRYYAEHKEELLLKNRKRYHANPETRRESARRSYAELKKSGSYYAKQNLKCYSNKEKGITLTQNLRESTLG